MARPYGVRDLPTWEMTDVELARIFADHFGYGVRPRSNWIYTPADRPICPGWESFAIILIKEGYIVHERGINWMQAHRKPHARTIAGYCAPTGRRRSKRGNIVRELARGAARRWAW